MIAAELADFDHGGDRSKSPNGGLKISEAAQALNVGERTVKRAKQVKNKAAVGGERWQIITAAEKNSNFGGVPTDMGPL